MAGTRDKDILMTPNNPAVVCQLEDFKKKKNFF